MSGALAYHAGRAAEDAVATDYERRGYEVAARRMRNPAGEIDLVLREGAGLVFVEVKMSRSFAAAAWRLGRRQMDRICAAAAAFLDGEPRGALTECRFDVALVNGRGELRIVENAFGTA